MKPMPLAEVARLAGGRVVHGDAATMVAGTPNRFATCPHAVMRKPSARPTRGNAASAWVDPKSVQADFGTGMRENVPNAAPIASAIFTL